MVGDDQRPAVGRHVANALRLDPPPDSVEEVEDREHRLGELLVEAPLVLVVLAPQAAGDRLERVAQLGRQRSGGALSRRQRVEAGLDPAAQGAEELGDRLGRDRVRARRLAHRPAPVSRPARAPG